MSRQIILYADSNEKERQLYSKIMKGAGYFIMDFNKGQPLLEKVSVIEPRLIILEIDLLHIDGLDICEHLRKIVNDKLPIIFFTKSDILSNLEQAIDAGGDDFLLKSGPSALLKRLQMWSQKSVRLNISQRRKRTKQRITKLKQIIATNGMNSTSVASHIDHVLGWEEIEFAHKSDNTQLGNLKALTDSNAMIDDTNFDDVVGISQDTSDFLSSSDVSDATPKKQPQVKSKPAKSKKEPVLDKKKLEQPVIELPVELITPDPMVHKTIGVPGNVGISQAGHHLQKKRLVSANKQIDFEWEGTNALNTGIESPNLHDEDASSSWDMLEDSYDE